LSDVDRLFRTYNAALVRYLTRRLGDRDWAEEVAQETFLRALRQESLTNERAWLFAVATNLVRDEARKASRQRRHLALLAEEVWETAVEPAESTL
jgi:RNA polymerase sigma-70 factor (ECF subfamily)